MTTIRDVFNSPDARKLSIEASIDFIERYLGFIIINPDGCRLVLKTHQNKYFDAPRLMTHKTKMGVYLATDGYGSLAGSLRKAVTGGQDQQVTVTGYLGLTLYQDDQTEYGVNFHLYQREANDYDDMIRVEIDPQVLQKTRYFFLNGVKDAISFTNARALLSIAHQFFDSLRWLFRNGLPLDAEISLLPEYCYAPTTKQFKHTIPVDQKEVMAISQAIRQKCLSGIELRGGKCLDAELKQRSLSDIHRHGISCKGDPETHAVFEPSTLSEVLSEKHANGQSQPSVSENPSEPTSDNSSTGE